LARYLKGNCDPFASYAITVSPRINQALNFMREAVYPATYFCPIFRQIHGDAAVSKRNARLPATFVKKSWEFATSSFKNEGLGLGCVASHVANLSMFLTTATDFNATRLALALTTKSSKIPRERMMGSGTTKGVIEG
jgi:hypothetical protein